MFRDTWEWDGSTWSLRASTGPSARFSSGMVFDSLRSKAVLFGGEGDLGGEGLFPRGDTWEWNGTVWAQNQQSGPHFRYAHTMAFDSNAGVCLLFGGITFETWGGEHITLADTWGFGPEPPTIARQPQDQIASIGESATFFVDAHGRAPVTYQWRHNGVGVAGGTGPSYTIPSVARSDAGTFDVQVFNECAVTASDIAVLTVTCHTDLNRDGVVNIIDYLAFLAGYSRGDLRCDFTGNGAVDVSDYLAFLAAYADGCR
jgi:hypothetical protein